MRKFLPAIFLFATVFVFSWLFISSNKLPIPSDTIIGLYHPFRDLHAKDYPNGIPFKNFLITDPVRQQYPWKNLATDLEKRFELPLWNPYNLEGTPLLANHQSSPFYPLNILLFVLPFEYGWSILILLQPILAGFFLYFYLNNLKLNTYSCLLGAISFAFCGFSVAWLEWGTIIHTALWLPLVLLSIDKLVSHLTDSRILNNKVIYWSLIFIFSLSSSLLAGHLQTFFYLSLLSVFYFIFRFLQNGASKKIFFIFVFLSFFIVLLTAIQWLPIIKFISLSARGIDQNWMQVGWFIPWQNLIQFIAPDFFGNPATLNYWGVWNYAEFIGYIGILPLIMAFFALFQRRDKLVLFFGSIFFLSLIFSLPTFFALVPFQLQIPFLSTAQPTRLLFLSDFSLAVLSAFGTDLLINDREKRKIIYPLIFVFIILICLWVFAFFKFGSSFGISLENINVAKRNLYTPTLLFITISIILFIYTFVNNKKLQTISLILLLIITCVELLRFAGKFTPFTNSEYLFPQTKSLSFLQNQPGQFRIMTTDDRILPPNFSIMYRLQTVEGYDPLYLLREGELIAASERGKPDIRSPFGFNRIITPHNFDTHLIDLIGVKYVLSLSDIKSSKLQKVFEEGQTKIYENKNAYSRIFFVNKILSAKNKNEAIALLFDQKDNLKDTAVVENWQSKKNAYAAGAASIVEYKENRVDISVQNKDDAFLVLTDTYYPTWHAKVCAVNGESCVETKIYQTDYNFRGIVIPRGKHKLIFEDSSL